MTWLRICLIIMCAGFFNVTRAQEVTLTDNQSFTVTTGTTVDQIEGENTSGVTITVETGGVVIGLDALELSDSVDATVIIYGTLDSADGGIVGDGTPIYNNPPGLEGNGDDAIVANDTTGLTVIVKDGALVLADDEFMNAGGATGATITIEEGARIFAEDQGIDDVEASTITINGYLQAGGTDDIFADGIDAGNGSTVTIGATGQVIATDKGIYSNRSGSNFYYVFGTVTGGDDGISASSDNNVVDVSGHVEGETDDAIDVAGNSTIYLRSSGVLVAGDNGIEGEDSNTVHIYGNITASEGIDLGSDTTTNVGANSVTLYASSNITASNIGVAFDNSGNNLDIYGTINATNDAVYVLGNDNIVVVHKGARLIGDLDAATGTTGNILRFDLGSAQSYVFGTTGDWTLQDLDGRTVVEGSAMSAGIGNVETTDELMFDRSLSLDNSLSRMQRQADFGGHQALFDAYRFSHSRDEHTTTSAYNLNSFGMTLGVAVEPFGQPLVAFVNYHDAELEIDNGTHDIDVKSLRLGLSYTGPWSNKYHTLRNYLVIGRNEFDGVRDVLVNQNTSTGLTTVDASWDSTEAEIGIDINSNVTLDSQFTIKTRLGLAAQIEHIGSYAEASYFAWDDRTVVQSHAKAEATLNFQAFEGTNIYGTAGLWRRDVHSGATADYSINGTAASYNGGIYEDTIASLRIGLGHRLTEGVMFSAEASAMESKSTDHGWGASVGISARF